MAELSLRYRDIGEGVIGTYGLGKAGLGMGGVGLYIYICVQRDARGEIHKPRRKRILNRQGLLHQAEMEINTTSKITIKIHSIFAIFVYARMG